MPPGSYSVFDHTADVGIDVAAPTPELLYETAALAMFDLLVDTSRVAPEIQHSIGVRGTDREEVLIRWLAELLYLHDAEGLVFSRFEITALAPDRLDARVWGEYWDAGRHEARTEIKAVTYHQVSVRQAGEQWRARVVFDV